jgi:hypothetical protein
MLKNKKTKKNRMRKSIRKRGATGVIRNVPNAMKNTVMKSVRIVTEAALEGRAEEGERDREKDREERRRA